MTIALKSPRPRAVVAIPLPAPAVCFAVAGGALFAVWIGFYLFDPFGYDNPLRDTWHHVAVLRELMAHPFDPSNPHLPTDEASRYYTPVFLLAALAGRAFAVSPYDLFGYLGAASLIGLAAGCWSFGRKYFGSRWAPLALLLSLLFAWGDTSSHAGFHNYATWTSSAAYPSSIALVLGLFLWSASLAGLERNGPLRLLGLAILAGVVFLTHQLSGAFMIAGAGCFVLFGSAPVRDKAASLAAIGLGTVATLAWPYFDILDVLASTTDDRWRSAFEMRNKVSTALMAALVPLAGIAGFRKRSGALRLELVVPTVVFALAYAVLQIEGSGIAHRLPPGFILFAQLGIVWLVLERGETLWARSSTRTGILAGVVLILAVAVVSASGQRVADLRQRAARGHTLETAGHIAAFLPAGSVSFATDGQVFPLQSTGRRVVSIPRPEPAAPSLAERQQATDRFFAAATAGAERRRLIERWGATHAVFDPAELHPDVVRDLRALGISTRFQHGVEVVTLARDVASAKEPAR